VRENVPRSAWVLFATAAAVFLLEKGWQIATLFSQTILLFALAALLAFIFNPLVVGLSANPIPAPLRKLAARTWGANVGRALERFHLPRSLAVVIVYCGLILILAAIVFLLLPIVVSQLIQLGMNLPEYTTQVPSLLLSWQNRLQSVGIKVDLLAMITSGEVVLRVQSMATGVVQNTLGFASSLASFLSSTLIILFLSFYMMLDGGRLVTHCIVLIPHDWQDEAWFLLREVDRTFGGFVRGQLIQAILFAIVTGVVMWAGGLSFVVIASLGSALLMIIPLIGVVLSLLPPVVIALFQSPENAWWILLILLIYQQFLINVVMPRVLSEVVGMHPLLIFGALLAGMRVAGLWGAFFGIPVAGVLYSLVAFFVARLRKTGQLAGDVPAERLGAFSSPAPPAPFTEESPPARESSPPL